MAKSISPEDRELFKQAMKNVQPLKKSDRLISPSSPKSLKTKSSINTNSTANHQEDLTPEIYLSDFLPETFGSEALLSYCQNGISPKQFQNFKNGKFLLEATLDLHHFTVDSARTKLLQFIFYCQKSAFRIVHIIHGKSGKSPNKMPILKNYVFQWLKQIPGVLAISSAAPKHGGAGAVYVLLKKGELSHNKKS